MKFCVVGNESELLDQCRKILKETVPEEWSLIQSARYSESPHADVYIWDFASDPCIPMERAEVVTRSLFVVESGQLDRFREALGTQRASIVLKPVLVPALRPFFEHALRQRRITSGAQSFTSDGPPRRDGWDDLLESVLHANLRLQEYDQSRTNFLARALHDFRAPLTALDGYCGLLVEQRIGSLSPDQLDLLRRMQHSVKRLSGLADAMFELSAGRHSKRELNVREADVEASINQAIHEVAQYAQQKQIRMSATVARPSQPFVVDAGKIEQVLINLLENACKFTPKQGSVEVSAYPVPWEYNAGDCSQSGARSLGAASETIPSNAYRIDVRDSGSGIPVEHIHSIFEEYTTYSGGRDRSGDGLGLAICRMIINAHHGAIWAESSPTGTQFSLVLPYGRPLSTLKMASTSHRLRSQAAAANTKKLSA
jgi:signal transduction histidine kinase